MQQPLFLEHERMLDRLASLSKLTRDNERIRKAQRILLVQVHVPLSGPRSAQGA